MSIYATLPRASRYQTPTAPAPDYNERAMAAHRANHPALHTSACNTASVDAFCDNVPDPGCTCPDPFVSGRYDHPCGWCESYDCDLDCSPNDES